MKKMISFLLASAVVGGVAFAGDFRLCFVLPVGTTSITNAIPLSVGARVGELAIISSSSSVTQSNGVSLVTGSYTNTIPLLASTTAMSATSTANLSTPAPVCVMPGDSLVCTMTGVTNTVPVYYYLSFVNGRAQPPFGQ